MPLPKDPAELEARLLSAVSALRQIDDALAAASNGHNPGAVRAVLTLCRARAAQAADEATS